MRCAGCGVVSDDPAVGELLCLPCVDIKPRLPTSWDEATETSDDISWGAAYGD